MSLYSWRDDTEFKEKFLPLTKDITLVGPERLYILYQVAKQVRSLGGVMVFDDYGFPSCPGAKKAVDEFFKSKIETPIYLPTGQCLVFKVLGRL